MGYHRKYKYIVRFGVNNKYITTKKYYKMNNKTKTKIKLLLFIYVKFF